MPPVPLTAWVSPAAEEQSKGGFLGCERPGRGRPPLPARRPRAASATRILKEPPPEGRPRRAARAPLRRRALLGRPRQRGWPRTQPLATPPARRLRARTQPRESCPRSRRVLGHSTRRHRRRCRRCSPSPNCGLWRRSPHPRTRSRTGARRSEGSPCPPCPGLSRASPRRPRLSASRHRARPRRSVPSCAGRCCPALYYTAPPSILATRTTAPSDTFTATWARARPHHGPGSHFNGLNQTVLNRADALAKDLKMLRSQSQLDLCKDSPMNWKKGMSDI